jgi:hypothetical protein
MMGDDGRGPAGTIRPKRTGEEALVPAGSARGGGAVIPRLVGALVAALLLTGLLTGCGGGGDPVTGNRTVGAVTASATGTEDVDTQAPSPAGSPASGSAALSPIDRAALEVTRAWLSYDTRVDHRPNDTARRLALPRLSPALRAEVTGFDTAAAAAPDAQWQDWTRRHAWATVSVALGGDDHPPDTADTAWRQVAATITLHGDQQWTDTVQQTEFVRLTSVQGTWLASRITTSAGA